MPLLPTTSPTEIIRRYVPLTLPTDNIRLYYTESCNKITSHAIITDGLSVGNAVGTFKGNYRRIYSVGNVPAGNFFWRARIRLYYHRWVVFLFATELATKMGFTDDCYTDGSVPSVSPSVLFSPTDCIAFTDGMIPSVKLDNVVVKKKNWKYLKKKKKLKGKKLVVNILDATLLCVIHSTTVENILFENGNGANILCAFYPTQTILHLQKTLLLIPGECG